MSRGLAPYSWTPAKVCQLECVCVRVCLCVQGMFVDVRKHGSYGGWGLAWWMFGFWQGSKLYYCVHVCPSNVNPVDSGRPRACCGPVLPTQVSHSAAPTSTTASSPTPTQLPRIAAVLDNALATDSVEAAARSAALRGVLLLRQDRWEAALTSAADALALDGRNALAWSVRSRGQARLGYVRCTFGKQAPDGSVLPPPPHTHTHVHPALSPQAAIHALYNTVTVVLWNSSAHRFALAPSAGSTLACTLLPCSLACSLACTLVGLWLPGVVGTVGLGACRNPFRGRHLSEATMSMIASLQLQWPARGRESTFVSDVLCLVDTLMELGDAQAVPHLDSVVDLTSLVLLMEPRESASAHRDALLLRGALPLRGVLVVHHVVS